MTQIKQILADYLFPHPLSTKWRRKNLRCSFPPLLWRGAGGEVFPHSFGRSWSEVFKYFQRSLHFSQSIVECAYNIFRYIYCRIDRHFFLVFIIFSFLHTFLYKFNDKSNLREVCLLPPFAGIFNSA